MYQSNVPRVTCPNCSRSVPDGEFCGACGAHLGSEFLRATHRPHSYAANPNEHVVHLSVVSTLFPHLPHRHTVPFEVGVGVTAILLTLLGLLRQTGPSIAVAAVAIPLLYLLYLYEVEVYEDEPVIVIGLTMVAGVAIGIPWAKFTGPIITRLLLENTTFGVVPGRLLLGAAVLPLVAQLLMLLGTIALYFRRRYDETLDGFTFGAAGALGFTMSSTVVNLWPELRHGTTSTAPVTTNVLDVLQQGLLLPVVNASLTGLIASAIWLNRGAIRRLRFHRWTSAIGTSVAIAVVLRVALGLVSVLAVDPIYSVVAYGFAAVAVLMWVRVALHHMLLSEAVDVSVGPDSVCTHCHRMVPRMAFCPHCGIATRATPKSGHGRANRTFR